MHGCNPHAFCLGAVTGRSSDQTQPPPNAGQKKTSQNVCQMQCGWKNGVIQKRSIWAINARTHP